MLGGKLSIHLVNTSGPHANAPDGGITEIKPIGPLTVSIRLEQAPQSIIDATGRQIAGHFVGRRPGNGYRAAADVIFDSNRATVNWLTGIIGSCAVLGRQVGRNIRAVVQDAVYRPTDFLQHSGGHASPY